MGPLTLGGGHIPRANGGERDLAGIHVKEYRTPTVQRDQRNVCSHKAMTYVLAAPDFNRSAGSIGWSVGIGFSRTLERIDRVHRNESGTG